MLIWITRDESGFGGLKLWIKKPERGNHYWKHSYASDYYVSLPDDQFLDVTWESEPKEIEISVSLSSSESLGDHLRNLMGSYASLVDVIRFYKNTGDHSLLDIIDLDHISEAFVKMIKFSESKIMEGISYDKSET